MDAHVHVFPPEIINRREVCLEADARFAALYGSAKARMATVDEVLAQMGECGVELSIIFGFAFKDLGLCREANDYVVQCVREHPSRLAGLACVPPGSPGAVAELERCLDVGLRGCGELAPVSATEQELAGLEPLAACLRERGLPMLVHASEPVGHDYPGKGRFTPEASVALAQALPGLTLVLSHLGGGAFVYEQMPEVRTAMKDVVYDTAALPYLYSPAMYQVAVLAAGADKLLFGSDYPLLSPTRCAAGLEQLPAAAAEAVCSGNARRVYRL